MKHIFIVFFCSLLTFHTIECYTQFSQQPSSLLLKEGKYKMELNGKEYEINQNILTVKPFSKELQKFQFEKIRENELGFVDIKIPENRNIEDYANELKKSGLYEIVEYNGYGEYLSFNPNDDWLENQWNIPSINMMDAWEFTQGDPSIVVAVLDCGIEWEHNDIGMGTDGYQNIFLNNGEDVWSNVNDPQTGNDIDDDNNGKVDDWKGWNFVYDVNDSRTYGFFHGTAVAGIISAKTNNNYGIAGIAGGDYGRPGVKVLPVTIGETLPDISLVDDAIIYSVNMGAKVINISFTFYIQSTSLNEAIDYAFDHNVIVICSSGNHNQSNLPYPASYPWVIAVGATTNTNLRWEDWEDPYKGSNYGNELDLVAPGESIPSTDLFDNFNYFSGTSYAAPQVSAVAALIYSINNNLSVYDVIEIIESTTQKIENYTFSTVPGKNYTWNNEVGFGLMDAYAALQEAACYSTIENTTYSSNINITGCNNVEMKNVKVKDGAKLTVDANSSFAINGAFEVELGGELEIK